MMIRVLQILFFLTIFASCASRAGANKLGIIIYTDFLYPNERFENLIADLQNTGLLDSIKVIGWPVDEGVLEFEVDSSAAKYYGIAFETLERVIDSAESLPSAMQIDHLFVENESGKQVPLSVVAATYYKQVDYKPEIFLREPEVFYYENEEAVKIELFCNRKNKKKLFRLMGDLFFEESGRCVYGRQWRVEFLK